MMPITALADDRFLVSYPRSGNTWMRFLLANLLRPGHPATFLDIESRVPDIYKFDDATLLSKPHPRVLKSHEPFDPRYRSVLYLVRDPRAVAVSYFHYQRRVGQVPPEMTMLTFVGNRFVRGRAGFGRWDDHVAGWLAAGRVRPGFSMVRYEDLVAAPLAELERATRALAIEIPHGGLDRAIAEASFSRLQELEVAAGTAWQGGREVTSADQRFIRQGTRDGWRQDLDEQSRQLIEHEFGPTMAGLGYSPA